MKTILTGSLFYLLRVLNEVRKEHRLMGVLMLLWSLITAFFSNPEMSAGINESVPLMVVLSLICFMMLVHLCWWLLNRFWLRVGLPGLGCMVILFGGLTSWQQVVLYWGSFALLLLSAIGCLAAVM
ncbi:MAG TPA: hypothetical protein VKB19_12205 [Pedobacter sp.]|nr:hypothetical protein [Pedobacter sp.]